MNDREIPSQKPLYTPLYSTESGGNRLNLIQWIVCFICIELVWTFLGGASTTLFSELTRNRSWSTYSWVIYLNQHINFVVLFGSIFVFVRYILRIPLRTFITQAPRFRWKLFRFSLFVWLVGVSIATLITALIEPQAIMLYRTPRIWDRLTLMILALLFTPLQCIAEELLFRTYVWRMMEGRIKKFWIPGVISGLIFTLAHLTNSELQSTNYSVFVLFYYFLTGFLFMEMTRIHGGSEAAFGAHIANNLFLVFIINYAGSSLPSDSWFIQQNPIIWLDLVVLSLCSACIIWMGKHKRFSSDS